MPTYYSTQGYICLEISMKNNKKQLMQPQHEESKKKYVQCKH